MLVLSTLLAPAMSPVPLVVYPASPRIFITTNAPYALAGDNVSFDVYTYFGGNLTDATGLPSVMASGAPVATDVSPVTRIGPGHYQAWLVLPSVLDGGRQTTSNALIVASANVGGGAVGTGTTVSWITPGLYLRLYSNIATVRPSQPMHLRAELYNGTRMVDADAGTMHFWTVGYLGARGGPMTPNRTALGVYEADVVLNSTAALGFLANATVGGVAVSAQLTSAQSPPFVPYAGFNPGSDQGWFETTFTNATRLRGTFWVADAWGIAVPGVAVTLGFGPLPGMATAYANGTTDAQGGMPVDVTASAGPTYVAGEIGAGTPEAVAVPATLTQRPVVPPPIPNTSLLAADPFLMPDGSLRDFLAPGAAVVRRYHVPASVPAEPGSSFADTPLNYYLVGLKTGIIYAVGHAVTDAGGNFSLSLTVPPEDFTLWLDIAGFLYSTVPLSYAVGSPDMGLQVSPLTLGGPTDVHASFAPTGARWVESEPPLALVWICPIPASAGMWSKWAPGFGCAEDSLRENAGGLNATLFLPSFLPPSGRYLVYAWVASQGGLVTQFAVLSPGQSASVGWTAGSGDLLIWAVLGVILGAVAVLGIALVLRRRPRVPPQPPPLPPSP